MNTQDVTILRRLLASEAPLDMPTLADETGLTPEVVNERLHSLAQCGFHFSNEASGVELDALPASLVPEAIAALLPDDCLLGQSIQVLKETGSTNDYVTRLGQGNAPHGTVVFALAQTGGRGRLGRRWHSPAGDGLWFSILLRPDSPIAHWPRLALAAGLGIARAAERLVARPVSTKWPNDVLIDRRKLAGILLESRAQGASGFVVLGVGINVNAESFPEEIAEIATSLKLASGCTFQMNRVAADLLAGLDDAIKLCMNDFHELLAQCSQRDALIGHPIEIHSGPETIEGHAMRLGPHGGIVLRSADGSEQEILHGEATLRKPFP